MQRYMNRRNTAQTGRRQRVFSEEKSIREADSVILPSRTSQHPDIKSEVHEELAPIQSLKECQEKIRARLNTLKDLFESEENKQKQVKEKYEIQKPA